jgi:hypothetical protein
MFAARRELAAIAEGDAVPLVYEQQEYFDGSRAWLVGHPIVTENGRSAIFWKNIPAKVPA